jgi:hypothetical protein
VGLLFFLFFLSLFPVGLFFSFLCLFPAGLFFSLSPLWGVSVALRLPLCPAGQAVPVNLYSGSL